MTALATRSDRIEVLGRVDLAALFEAHGLPQGRNKQWPCPSPNHAQSGATPPVTIRTLNGREVWCCHACPAGGTAVDLLVAAKGITVAEAFQQLRNRTGILAATPPMQARPKAPTAPPGPLDHGHGRIVGDEGEQVLASFLEARHWTSEAAEAFGLYAVRNKAQGVAIRFPYRSGGEVVWFQDRGTTDRGPKWTNPSGHPRIPYAVDLVMALESAALDTPPSLFVVEGPADTVALWHAAPSAVVIGLPGTQGIAQWATALAGVDVLLVLDPDPAGDKAAAEMAPAIHAVGGRSARLRPPLDLDDWRREVGDDGLRDGLQALAESVSWWTL